MASEPGAPHTGILLLSTGGKKIKMYGHIYTHTYMYRDVAQYPLQVPSNHITLSNGNVKKPKHMQEQDPKTTNSHMQHHLTRTEEKVSFAFIFSRLGTKSQMQ